MIAQVIDKIDQQSLSCPAILAASRTWTYRQLIDASHSLADQWAHLAGTQVVLALTDFPSQMVALLALERLVATAILAPAQPSTTTLRSLCEALQPAEIITDLAPLDDLLRNDSRIASAFDGEVAGVEPRGTSGDLPDRSVLGARGSWNSPLDPSHPIGSVVMFTSGTSGPPRPVRHSWSNLASAVHNTEPYRCRRWLLAYQLGTFAGVQVWLQALLSEGTVCVPESNQPEAIATALIDQKVEFASATPTYWRMLLGSVSRERLANATLQQITLGGETVDQEILDHLAVTFPAARISHIYASTEMGVCFSVHDGQAGFPVDLLDSDARSSRLRISDQGELEIQSDRAMLAKPSHTASDRSWFPTGDLVQVKGNRVYFAGRKSGTINVGGSKVQPEEVEAVIRRVPGVFDVRVVALASSMVGQLVQAEVLAQSDCDRDLLRERILAQCRSELPKHKVPAAVQFLERLESTPSGKLARSVEQTS